MTRLAARALSVGLVLLVGCAHVEPSPPMLDVYLGSLPRETVGPRLEPARLKGRVVLITFIASWCFPCLTDLVSLKKLEADFGPRGFANVLVGMDREGRRVLEPFVAEFSLPFPLVVSDEALRAGQTPMGHVLELPTRVLFDRDGNIVKAWVGVVDYGELEKAISRVLGQ